MNKRQKRFVSAVCILLAVLMALSVILMVIPAGAVSETEIEEIHRKRVALAEELEQQAALVLQLSESHALIVDRKAALDRQIELNRQDIALLEEEIRAYDALISEKQQELAAAQQAEKNQAEAMRERIRAMEESGDYSYLEFVFASTSLADLLSRLGDVSDLMHYDKELEELLRQTRADVEELTKEYEQIQLEQDAIRSELSQRQNQLNGQLTAAASLIAHLNEMGEEAVAEFAAIQAAEEQAARAEAEAIARLQKEREDARRAAEQLTAPVQPAPVQTAPSQPAAPASEQPLADSDPAPAQQPQQPVTSAPIPDGPYSWTYSQTYLDDVNKDGSNFIWPTDSKYVTSLFGDRSSPTVGASSNHPAIDIGATAGSPIYAAADGQVAIADYNNGLGNYVSIDHGDDTSTRYSHMTNFIVAPGEYVKQGQIIGYVGQTGIATGDHLDFAILEDGVPVDPLQFYEVGNITFDPTA